MNDEMKAVDGGRREVAIKERALKAGGREALPAQRVPPSDFSPLSTLHIIRSGGGRVCTFANF
jgi:hypothetical protein